MNPKSDSCPNGVDANDVPGKEMEANPAEDDDNHDEENANIPPIHVVNGSDNSRKLSKNAKLACLCDQERYYLGRFTRPFDGCCSSRCLNITVVQCMECNQVMDLINIPGHFMAHLTDSIPLINTCIKCCRVFDNLYDLNQHQQAVFNGMSPNYCPKCHRKNLNWQWHKGHMNKMHLSENFYQLCPLCDFQSTLLSRMTAHIALTHRVVPCPYCLMLTDIHVFALNDTYRDKLWKEKNLNRELLLFWMHLQKHLSVKDKFSCNKCLLNFLNPADLAEHKEFHNFVSKKPPSELSNNEFYPEQENKDDFFNKEEFSRFFQRKKLRNPSYILKATDNRIVPPENKKTTRKNAVYLFEGLSTNQPSKHQTPVNLIVGQKSSSSGSESKIKSIQLAPDSEDLIHLLPQVSTDPILMQIILHLTAIAESYFLPNSCLQISYDSFMQLYRNGASSNYINTLNAKLLKNYGWICLTCEKPFDDITHFSAKIISCDDEHCAYETLCTNDILFHHKYIDRLNLNEPTFFIIGSRFLEEPDRRLVTDERLIQAREFDPLYQVEDEVEEIRREFPNDPCPFYIHVCLQCALSFSTPLSAAYHLFHVDNTKRNDLGIVHGLEQTHVVYRRCLIRTSRYNDEDIQIELDLVLQQQGEKILEYLKKIFKTEIAKSGRKYRNFASYSGRYVSPASRLLNSNDYSRVDDCDSYSNFWSRPLSLEQICSHGHGAAPIRRDRPSGPGKNSTNKSTSLNKSKKARK